MILNGWWDRDRAKVVACTEDPGSPLVSYGTPVSGGESPSRLMVPTFSDELRARGNGSRIVTFSMKARSAIGLAGHGADAATWFSDTGSWVTSAAYSSAPVPFVADFIK